jgi:uncharacterized protein YdhG (YjbR/CyaY superfamily)
MPARKASPIDAYLTGLPADQRAALEKLRKQIRAAAPKAEECLSYGMPAFRHGGRPLVGFSASAKHCSLFPMDGTTVAAFKSELRDFSTSKGTIRFTSERPIPAALVRRIVKARVAENAARDPDPEEA